MGWNCSCDTVWEKQCWHSFVNILEVNRQAIYRTRSAGQNISQYIGCTREAQIRQKVFLGFSTYFSSRSWILLFTRVLESECWAQFIKPLIMQHPFRFQAALQTFILSHVGAYPHLQASLFSAWSYIWSSERWDKNCVCACISIAV